MNFLSDLCKLRNLFIFFNSQGVRNPLLLTPNNNEKQNRRIIQRGLPLQRTLHGLHILHYAKEILDVSEGIQVCDGQPYE